MKEKKSVLKNNSEIVTPPGKTLYFKNCSLSVMKLIEFHFPIVYCQFYLYLISNYGSDLSTS